MRGKALQIPFVNEADTLPISNMRCICTDLGDMLAQRSKAEALPDAPTLL